MDKDNWFCVKDMLVCYNPILASYHHRNHLAQRSLIERGIICISWIDQFFITFFSIDHQPFQIVDDSGLFQMVHLEQPTIPSSNMP